MTDLEYREKVIECLKGLALALRNPSFFKAADAVTRRIDELEKLHESDKIKKDESTG